MAREVLVTSTSQVASVVLLGDDGLPLTGQAYNAAGLKIWAGPVGGTRSNIALSVGNWTETAAAGVYEVDLPDILFATEQTIEVSGAITDGAVIGEQIQVVAASTNAQHIRDAMKLAPSVGAAAAGSIDAKIDAIDPLDATETQAAAAAAIAVAGLEPLTGPYVCTWTIEYDGTPLAGAAVAFYLSGTLRGRGTTDTFGQVSMGLAAGTYDVAIVRDGYVHTPETHEVTSDDASWEATFDGLTPVATVPTPTTPDTCTGYALVYDEEMVLEAGASICCRLVAEPDGSGTIGSGTTRTEVSDAAGQVVFTGLWIGAQYRFWRAGSDRTFTITITAADVDDEGRFPLPHFYG